MFNATSAITPFLFGIIAAAVASENIRVQGKSVETDLATTWLMPFALAVDVMAVALCAALAAIYLAVENEDVNERELANMYRWSAAIASAMTAILGAGGPPPSPGSCYT
ncbi:MAG: cytochrome d ubiquinol oxidase subunit II [Ktedonobacteraceae bacterium]